MNTRSIRHRLNDSTNLWPGFVDVLATLLIVIIFVLMVFTVSQIYLSDAISGRDKALEDLRSQIDELSKILIIESKEKQLALEDLSKTESALKSEQSLTMQLESQISEDQKTILTQMQNISLLSTQIEELLNELKIVAKALETYEGIEITSLDTSGLGERINKALAARIDQLNNLNKQLTESQAETAEQLQIVNDLNQKLSINETKLEEQISLYQQLTNDLIAINESLGLEDAGLIEQLEAIKNKNIELANLNQNLIEKDATIFDLRDKIFELNNILSINEETQLSQETEIANLASKLKLLEDKNMQIEESTSIALSESEKQASLAVEQISTLSNEIDVLKNEITTLNAALEASEENLLTKELKIEVLGERLNKALTSKVFELQKYRSEFFGRLQTILGERKDIKVVGDRFIFESELLFDSGSAILQTAGKEKLKQIGLTLKDTTSNIPDDIDWIIQVEGHTDKNPISTLQFPSNWELSSARANEVLKLLLEIGFEPRRLSAAGYAEFYPIAKGETIIDFQQNRRIELRLTSR